MGRSCRPVGGNCPGSGSSLFVYVLIPGTVCLSLLWGYFFGGEGLREIIAPGSNREFGLLENLQNACLIGIGAVGARSLFGLLHEPGRRFEKGAMALVLAGAVFMLLEEIDYGVHYYEWLKGLETGAYGGFRNIHNIGDNSSRLKHLGNVGIVLWFVLFPLVLSNNRNPLIRYFLPSRWFVAAVACTFAIMEAAKALNRLQGATPHPLQHSITEFRELLDYYTALLYVVSLSRRHLPAQSGSEPG